MNSNSSAQLLTIDEVASRLKISKTTVRKWMKFHGILPIKIGRRTLFTEAEICRWIEVLESLAREQQTARSQELRERLPRAA